MSNPLVHAVIFTIAVVIPGGLLVYFAWRAYKLKKAKVVKNTQKNLPDLKESEIDQQHASSDKDYIVSGDRYTNKYRHMDRV
jgi:hypothetical protein